MSVRLRSCIRWLATAAILWIAGCAPLTTVPPGTPAAAVEASRGKPYRIWPEANGASSWEYPLGPSGRYTYMVRVGPDGRVDRVDQVLDLPTFARLQPGMKVQELEHTLGRPYSKTYLPLIDQDQWAWRWMESNVWKRCFYAYLSRHGALVGTGMGDENVGRHGILSGWPC